MIYNYPNDDTKWKQRIDEEPRFPECCSTAYLRRMLTWRTLKKMSDLGQIWTDPSEQTKLAYPVRSGELVLAKTIRSDLSGYDNFWSSWIWSRISGWVWAEPRGHIWLYIGIFKPGLEFLAGFGLAGYGVGFMTIFKNTVVEIMNGFSHNFYWLLSVFFLHKGVQVYRS